MLAVERMQARKQEEKEEADRSLVRLAQLYNTESTHIVAMIETEYEKALHAKPSLVEADLSTAERDELVETIQAAVEKTLEGSQGDGVSKEKTVEERIAEDIFQDGVARTQNMEELLADGVMTQERV